MDIQEKFKKETGIYAYDTDNQKYKREYIIWLENHIEQLALTDVSHQRELLKGFIDWFNKTDKTQSIINERAEEYLKTL